MAPGITSDLSGTLRAGPSRRTSGRPRRKCTGLSATRFEFRRRPRPGDARSQMSRSREVFRPLTTSHAPGRTVHRYYDPVTGQFVSVDPLVSQTEQPYIYADDNPVNEVDRNGSCTTPLWFTFGWDVYANICGTYWPIFVFVSLFSPEAVVGYLSLVLGGWEVAAAENIISNFIPNLRSAFTYAGKAAKSSTDHDCYQFPVTVQVGAGSQG